MAKAKYTKQKNGYFQTRVWDGSYNDDGTKHYIMLRSKKSSKDLENKVNQLAQDVEMRKHLRISDVTFLDYAKAWLQVYKAGKETNTQAMYKNIIDKHFVILKGVKLQDIGRVHYQMLMTSTSDKKRTQQQIQITFKQVLRSAVSDRLFAANVFEDICNNMDVIKYRPTEKRPLMDYEQKALFKAELSTQDKVFVYILFGCGLRRGDDDDKIRLNQRKPSKYKGLSRFGPEKNLQRINKFMKERPIFYKNLIQMKENFRFYLRCFYCITKVVILQFNSEKQDRISS